MVYIKSYSNQKVPEETTYVIIATRYTEASQLQRQELCD